MRDADGGVRKEAAVSLLAVTQGFLGLPALGDVGDGGAVGGGGVPPGREVNGYQLHRRHPPFRPRQAEFGHHPRVRLPAASQVVAEEGVVFVENVVNERPADEVTALSAQYGGAGEVDPPDDAACIHVGVPEGGEVVEVGVEVAGLLQGLLGQPQFLVLHLQFDLVGHEFFLDQLLIGDVAGIDDDAADGRVVEQVGAGGQHPAPLPALREDAVSGLPVTGPGVPAVQRRPGPRRGRHPGGRDSKGLLPCSSSRV